MISLLLNRVTMSSRQRFHVSDVEDSSQAITKSSRHLRTVLPFGLLQTTTDLNYYTYEKTARVRCKLIGKPIPSGSKAVVTIPQTDNNRVKRFIEKPPRTEATSHWINAGIYFLEPEVLQHIPSGQHYMFEKGLFPRILELGAPVYGYPYRGYWLDMGTPEKYFSVNMDMLSARVQSPGIDSSRPDEITYGPDAVVDPAATITAPVLIDNGSHIDEGASIKGPVVMGRDCHVEARASIENSILWDGVSIGAGARLNRCIIASGMSVPAEAEMTDIIITASRQASFHGGG